MSNEKVAVQPTLTVSHESGVYAGVWGSSLPDSPAYGKFELDVYGGFNTEIAPGTTADIGVNWYTYPGSDDGGARKDHFDGIAKLSPDIGPVSVTSMITYPPDQESHGDQDNTYIDLGAGFVTPHTTIPQITAERRYGKRGERT